MRPTGTGIIAVSTIAFVALGGCGGGGGGGGGGDSAPTTTSATFSALPEGTNATLSNPTATQTMSALSVIASDPAPPGVRPLSVAVNTEFQVTLRPGVTNPTGNFQITTAVSSPSRGVNLTQTFTTENSLSSLISDSNMLQRVFVLPNLVAGQAHSAMITNVPGSASPTLSYQLFGFWTSTQSTPNQGIGVFSVGNIVTPAQTIPTSGSAVYAGAMSGFLSTNVNASGVNTFNFFTARVSAEAFFVDRRIEFTSSNTLLRNDLTGSVAPTPDASYNLSGTLNWNAGTNQFQGTVANGALTGPATGRFYGPGAEELGGVLHANDGTRQMIGTFGAAR